MKPEGKGSAKKERVEIDFSKVKVEPLFEEEVDFDTFSKSDFRAVKIKSCEEVKKSDKLLKFVLNDGSGEDRVILSGIKQYYDPEELVGKTAIAIVNLPPRKMMGEYSNGMLISAVNEYDGEEMLNLLLVDDRIPAGAVTFNPAIDYIVRMDKPLDPGMTNRSASEECYFGGKGINVSTVLKNLGIENTALGFAAGFTGEAIVKSVNEKGIIADFIMLKEGISRINVKIKSDEETEINGQGPKISDEAYDELLQKLDKLKEGDVLILAGSIPKTLPSNVYEIILERLYGKGIMFVVDATKDLLLKVLKYKPFLIKPNNHELGEMFGVVLKTDDEIEEYARKLQEMGARNVLISMAKDGAMLITEDGQRFRVGVPKGKVKNSVGAGDSMVAGFVAGYMKSHDYRVALNMGTAAGSATAFSDDLATGELINSIYETL